MAQQTAVEWLVNQLRLPTNIRFTDDEKSSYKELIEEAKEMFQQQIESAWKRGDGEHDKVADKLAKQYYNETYTK
jgi:DNA-directed RNA polymerase